MNFRVFCISKERNLVSILVSLILTPSSTIIPSQSLPLKKTKRIMVYLRDYKRNLKFWQCPIHDGTLATIS